MKRFAVAALAVIALGAPLLLAQAVQQEPRFKSGTHTVSVYATVVDQSGRLVPNLTRDDFEVLDNGTPRELSLFANTVQPITIVVMLDRSGSMERQFPLVQKAATTFIDHLLPADRARVGSFSTKVQIDPESFTSDAGVLRDILREKLLPPGPTPLWSATAAAIDALKDEEGRRVVLVFTDGEDSSTPKTATTSFDQVLTRVESEDVMVYAIGLASCNGAATSVSPTVALAQKPGQGRGGTTPPPPPVGRGRVFPRPPASPPGIPGMPPPTGPFTRPPATKPDDDPLPCRGEPAPNLKELADAGGGGFFKLRSADGLSGTFARVADELHHQYLLAFPASTFDGKMHELQVRVRPAALTVRARKSYLAPTEK